MKIIFALTLFSMAYNIQVYASLSERLTLASEKILEIRTNINSVKEFKSECATTVYCTYSCSKCSRNCEA